MSKRKKYRVMVREAVVYAVDIRAHDVDEAREAAEELLINAANRDDFVVEVEDREATDVMEDPPIWEESVALPYRGEPKR